MQDPDPLLQLLCERCLLLRSLHEHWGPGRRHFPQLFHLRSLRLCYTFRVISMSSPFYNSVEDPDPKDPYNFKDLIRNIFHGSGFKIFSTDTDMDLDLNIQLLTSLPPHSNSLTPHPHSFPSTHSLTPPLLHLISPHSRLLLPQFK